MAITNELQLAESFSSLSLEGMDILVEFAFSRRLAVDKLMQFGIVTWCLAPCVVIVCAGQYGTDWTAASRLCVLLP